MLFVFADVMAETKSAFAEANILDSSVDKGRPQASDANTVIDCKNCASVTVPAALVKSILVKNLRLAAASAASALTSIEQTCPSILVIPIHIGALIKVILLLVNINGE